MKASLLSLLLLVCLFGTARAASPVAAAIDWDAASRETVELLRALIRIDPINPPPAGSTKQNADETALLRHVQGELAKDGIGAEIIARPAAAISSPG